MSENGEIYTAGKNFTLLPAVAAWTNSTYGRLLLIERVHRGFNSILLATFFWDNLYKHKYECKYKCKYKYLCKWDNTITDPQSLSWRRNENIWYFVSFWVPCFFYKRNKIRSFDCMGIFWYGIGFFFMTSVFEIPCFINILSLFRQRRCLCCRWRGQMGSFPKMHRGGIPC